MTRSICHWGCTWALLGLWGKKGSLAGNRGSGGLGGSWRGSVLGEGKRDRRKREEALRKWGRAVKRMSGDFKSRKNASFQALLKSLHSSCCSQQVASRPLYKTPPHPTASPQGWQSLVLWLRSTAQRHCDTLAAAVSSADGWRYVKTVLLLSQTQTLHFGSKALNTWNAV